MKLDPPFWFRQRQAKAEAVTQGSYKLTGPNLPEAIVGVRVGDDLRWRGILKSRSDGPDLAETPGFRTATEAMSAAFDLYREYVVN